jgi:hypothetical protein
MMVNRWKVFLECGGKRYSVRRRFSDTNLPPGTLGINERVTYENDRIDKVRDKVRDKVFPEPRTLNPEVISKPTPV